MASSLLPVAAVCGSERAGGEQPRHPLRDSLADRPFAFIYTSLLHASEFEVSDVTSRAAMRIRRILRTFCRCRQCRTRLLFRILVSSFLRCARNELHPSHRWPHRSYAASCTRQRGCAKCAGRPVAAQGRPQTQPPLPTSRQRGRPPSHRRAAALPLAQRFVLHQKGSTRSKRETRRHTKCLPL